MIRTLVEYWCARAFLGLLAALPKGSAFAVARGATRLLDLAIPRLRKSARINLAFGLSARSAAERERIIDGIFTSIARMLVSLSRFPSLNKNNIHEWIRYEGFEHFERALKLGRGVLFYTAHLGNWELSAFAHALMSRPMHVVVRPLDNPRIDSLVARFRALSGNSVIEKKDFARGILKALAANQAVGILADQNVGLNEGVFVEFFGKSACAHPGFARIAAHARATVIPGYALWSVEEGRYILRFFPPVEMTGDSVEDTQRLHRQLESAIRQHPDQWLWIHRRWKTRPPGEPPIY